MEKQCTRDGKTSGFRFKHFRFFKYKLFRFYFRLNIKMEMWDKTTRQLRGVLMLEMRTKESSGYE